MVFKKCSAVRFVVASCCSEGVLVLVRIVTAKVNQRYLWLSAGDFWRSGCLALKVFYRNTLGFLSRKSNNESGGAWMHYWGWSKRTLAVLFVLWAFKAVRCSCEECHAAEPFGSPKVFGLSLSFNGCHRYEFAGGGGLIGSVFRCFRLIDIRL